MLENISIKQTDFTPLVCFDRKKMTLKFEGVLVPENPFAFFNPIFKWLTIYELAPIKDLSFEFDLDHFNTSSARMLLEMMKRIQKIKDQKVIWSLYADDEDMVEVVNDYNELLGGGITVNLKEENVTI